MSETVSNRKVYTLLEISESISRAFQKWYANSYWVKAEMNKLNHYPHSGHCYPDLVERREGKVVAQFRANLWATDYNRINNQFLQFLKEPLKDGINILFLAKVNYHPVYGVSLVISDIDPSYTLGDLEKEKLETINRLKSEGIFFQNKSLKLPLLPQRLAIISVETSRGFADFKSVIDGNAWGYRFFYMMFPSLLQGEKAVDSIIFQLNNIRKVLHHFDLVAIIRGGGGDVGLSSYNHYRLAFEMATFPIPVLSGIGHSTNETVTEMVAWKNAITPTELADFLIQRFHNFSVPLQEMEKKLKALPQQQIGQHKNFLIERVRYFKLLTMNALATHQKQFFNQTYSFRQAVAGTIFGKQATIDQQKNMIKNAVKILLTGNSEQLYNSAEQLKRNSRAFIKNTSSGLTVAERQVNLLHPVNVLKRGYSITRIKGRAVTDVSNIEIGEEIETTLFEGKITSEVKSTQKK